MKIQLCPRRAVVYGQDLITASLAEKFDIECLYADANGYPFDSQVNYELVISHNPDDERDSTFLRSLSPEIPVAIHLHLQWSFLDESQRKHLRISAQNARLGIVPAQFLADVMVREIPHLNWQVIHNSCDENRYYPSNVTERVEFKRALGISDHQFLIIYVGRIEDAKGLQLLEEVARNLPANCSLIIQFLAFSGNKQTLKYQSRAEKIKSYAPEQIFLIQDRDLSSERPVRYADVLLLPSLKEVAPMVVIEALSSGIPVISTESTPYFKELQTLGMSQEDILLVDNPSRLIDLPRSQLVLTPGEIKSTGKAIGRNLTILQTNSEITSDEKRIQRSEKARTVGLTHSKEVERLAFLYSQIS